MEAEEISVLMDAIEDKLQALQEDLLLLSSLGKFAIRPVSSYVTELFSSMERHLQLLLHKQSSRNEDEESCRMTDGGADVVTELPSESADCPVCLERLRSDDFPDPTVSIPSV